MDKSGDPEGRTSIPPPAVCVRREAFRNGHWNDSFRSLSLRDNKGFPLAPLCGYPIYEEVLYERGITKNREELAHNQKKLAIYEHRQARLDARIRQLEKGARAKRTHRLITRGAAVESVCPELKNLTEQEYYSLTEQIYALPEVQALVRRAIGNGGDP